MIATLMGLRTIAPNELNELMQAGQVTIFDVNPRHSWMKARVPGAINIDQADYDEGALPQEKNDLLVFYCSGPLCRKAPYAARRAKKLGYSNVRVMSAGINGWLSAKLPIEGEERARFQS